MIDIDENVERLVSILNKYPDISTTSSCGGHEKPDKFQLPVNMWTISIGVPPRSKRDGSMTLKAWQSLGKISHAAMEYLQECDEDDSDICIHFWNASDRETDPDGECNAFEIEGTNADIELFCDILERYG